MSSPNPDELDDLVTRGTDVDEPDDVEGHLLRGDGGPDHLSSTDDEDRDEPGDDGYRRL